MGVILDTSLYAAYERERFDLFGFIEHGCGDDDTFITALIASELLHGWHRAPEGKRKDARKAFLDGIFEDTVILPFDFSTAEIHAQLWADLLSRGQIINGHDMLIAATCLLHGHDIATLNRKDFERIPGLALRDVSAYEIPIS